MEMVMKKMQDLIIKNHQEKKLSFEFIPRTSKQTSLFHHLIKKKNIKAWEEIKEILIEKEGNNCWICGKKDSDLRLHEFWDFNDEDFTLELREIHHVCDKCQKTIQSNFWFNTEYGREQLKIFDITREEIIKHFCQVNNCDLKKFAKMYREALETWRLRNQHQWKVKYNTFIVKED